MADVENIGLGWRREAEVSVFSPVSGLKSPSLFSDQPFCESDRMRKYSVTNIEFELPNGKKLTRIKAVRDFGHVRAGTVGGFIEDTKNLSQSGLCWIGGDAVAYGDAHVTDDALLDGFAMICDRVSLTGASHVGGSARLMEQVFVAGHAQILNATCLAGCATVLGDARLLCQPFYSRSGKTVLPNLCDNVRVSGYALLEGRVSLRDEAEVCDFAHLRGLARMFEKSRATGSALIEGRAVLSGRAVAMQHCQIRDRAVVTGASIVAGHSVICGKSLVTCNACMVGDAFLQNDVLSGDQFMATTRNGDIYILNAPPRYV